MTTLNTENSLKPLSENELLALPDGSDALRRVYERSGALQKEFLDFGCFQAYLVSLKAGKSSICSGRGVVRSNVSESKTFLAN